MQGVKGGSERQRDPETDDIILHKIFQVTVHDHAPSLQSVASPLGQSHGHTQSCGHAPSCDHGSCNVYTVHVRVTPVNIPKQALCRLYKKFQGHVN